MLIFDAHCHFESVKDDLLQRRIAVPSIYLNDAAMLINYQKRNKAAKIGFGLHPWFISANLDLNQLKIELKTLIQDKMPDFIGESGLDKNKPNFELQMMSLEIHLEIAEEFNLPVNLHCVRAYNELLQILTKFPKIRGVVHAYNGNKELAKLLAKKNLKLGIGSILLNTTSQLAKSIKNIPDDQLVLETDAPYMPLPGRNSSSPDDSFIYAQRLAQLKNINLMELIHKVNQNWLNLYQADKPGCL